MKEQKPEKPEPEKPEQVQKPLRQGQPEETRVASAEDKADSAMGSTGLRGVAEGGAIRSLSPGQKPQRPESTMHSDPPIRKSRGRLTRDAMKIIGKTLEAYYEDRKSVV